MSKYHFVVILKLLVFNCFINNFVRYYVWLAAKDSIFLFAQDCNTPHPPIFKQRKICI